MFYPHPFFKKTRPVVIAELVKHSIKDRETEGSSPLAARLNEKMTFSITT